jgi:hypothetical protein
MKKILFKTTVGIALILTCSALLIYWMEAEKEIRVLCSMFDQGDSIEHVTTTLDTANLLNYSVVQNDTGASNLLAESPFNLYSSECIVSCNDQSIVTDVQFSKFFDLNIVLAVSGSLILLVLSSLQLLLSFGLPFGEYFWGGYHKILPVHLRIGSFVSFLLLGAAMLILLDQIEWIEVLPINFPISELNIFYAVLFMISTLANLNSESKKEMRLMTPAAGFLYLSFLSAIFVQ